MARVDDSASLASAEAEVARDAARRLDIIFRSGAGIFSVLLLLIAWEVFARSGKVTAFMLPPFSAVAQRIYADAVTGDLWRNLGLTMFRALTGFVIATIGGVTLGAMMARMSAIGNATCSPVRICGKAAGSATCHINSRSLAPIFRPDQINSLSTPASPASVAVTTGKMASNTTTEIFETS